MEVGYITYHQNQQSIIKQIRVRVEDVFEGYNPDYEVENIEELNYFNQRKQKQENYIVIK